MNNVTLRKYFMSRIDSLQREVEFLQESVKALDAEESSATDASTPKAEAAPKKEKAAPKKEKAAPKVEAVEETTTSDDDDFLNDEELDAEITAPTIDDVRSVLKEFAAKKGKDKALKLLNKFGVENVAKLDKSNYQAAIDLAKRYL